MLVLLLIAGLVACIAFRSYIKAFFEYRQKAKLIAAKSTESDFKISENSFVYAFDGSLISTLSGERKSYYLKLSDIPKYVKDCVLAVEDRRFYTHNGYDIKGIAAAIKTYVDTGTVIRGGSTITQQLARNIYLSMEVTMERKITEILLAAELEKKYSKDKILEYYLNNIYFANGYYGIEAASYGYFGKGVSSLSLSQIAFLCGIPNNPTKYDPKKHFDDALARRDKVLDQMFEYGGLKESEYRAALSEKLELVETVSEKQNYAETFSYYCAIRAIMRQKGFVFRNEFLDDADKTLYEEQYYEQYYTIQRTLFTGGYRIYTSIDPELQEKLQNALDTELEGFNETDENGTYSLQGSAVCIDNETGRVCAIIGGRSQETTGYTLNRAYQSFRQTGSSTKPLIIYTPLFERGTSPEDRVLDEYFEGGPKNSGGYYYGDISVREAVGVSANTVAWKLFTDLTPKVGLSYLLKMDFSHIVASDYYPATSLGGFTYGASAVEMASAYATLENDGIFRTPTCIITIRDSEGKTIVADPMETKRVYQQNAARIMTDVMKDVMKTGTGHNLKLSNAISAGKTGTATNQCDGWFAGFTKYYTTAVWIGYDYPKKLEGLTGNSYPGHVWKNFMEDIHNGLEQLDFAGYTDPGGKTNDPGKEPTSYYPEFDAFGNPIDPETGLPYPTATPVPTEGEEPEGSEENGENKGSEE